MPRSIFAFPQGVRKHFLLPARGAQTVSHSRRENAGMFVFHALTRLSADAAQHFCLPAGSAQTSRTGSADSFSFPQGECRGARLSDATVPNEAVHQRGKPSLISLVYLQRKASPKYPKSTLFSSLASVILYGCCNLSTSRLVRSVFLRISSCRAKVCVCVCVRVGVCVCVILLYMRQTLIPCRT